MEDALVMPSLYPSAFSRSSSGRAWGLSGTWIGIGLDRHLVPFFHQCLGCFIQVEPLDGVFSGRTESKRGDRLHIVRRRGQPPFAQKINVDLCPDPHRVKQRPVKIKNNRRNLFWKKSVQLVG